MTMGRRARPPATLLPLLLVLIAAAGTARAVFVGGDGHVHVSLGQVTHESCANHRNGPALAVAKINELNGGRGFALGFDRGSFVKFSLSSRTVPESVVVSSPEYVVRHQALIQELLAQGVDLFIGSCSQGSEAERDLIDAAQKLLVAQVGPDAYYIDAVARNQTNVFGMHVSSYRYTEPFLKLAQARGARTVAIAGRLQSLFFETTCSQARQFAVDLEMDVLLFRQYDHSNLALSQNATYQRELALDIAHLRPDVVIGCIGGGLGDEPVVWLVRSRPPRSGLPTRLPSLLAPCADIAALARAAPSLG